jgi:hypothetical protein
MTANTTNTAATTQVATFARESSDRCTTRT